MFTKHKKIKNKIFENEFLETNKALRGIN